MKKIIFLLPLILAFSCYDNEKDQPIYNDNLEKLDYYNRKILEYKEISDFFEEKNKKLKRSIELDQMR